MNDYPDPERIIRAAKLAARRHIPAATDSRIEGYLAQVCGPLVGRVPATRLAELRAELRTHLEARAEAFRELGSGAEEAVWLALEQLGDPRRLSREWLREWRQPGRTHPAASILAAGVLGVSTLFGAALLVTLEQHLGHNAFELVLGGPFLPLVAGLLVGLWRGKHTLGSRLGLLLIAAAGTGVSLLMGAADPRPPVVLALRVLLWLWIGCGTAGLGALVSEWRDRWPLEMAGA
jgi:hypothetical protein